MMHGQKNIPYNVYQAIPGGKGGMERPVCSDNHPPNLTSRLKKE